MLAGGYGEQGLQAAILVATVKHINVLDKSGQPYILHPLRVMAAVRHLGHEAMIKAVLHDVVEDTDMTLEDIERGWGSDVRRGVDAVTQRKGLETYFEYVRRCRDSDDPHAIPVKLADLDDNEDPTRAFDGEVQSGSDPAASHSWQSLVRRYVRARRILERLEA